MLHRSRCWIVVAAAVIAACGKKDTPPPTEAPAAASQPSAPMAPASTPAEPASAPAPASATLTSVTLGKFAGTDRKLIAADVFAQGDTVHASVGTEGTGSATLGVRWSHDKSGKRLNMAEETVTISSAGPATTEFRFAPPKGMPAGDYQVEIMLDGAPVATHSFKVQQAAAARPKPSATLKAKPGKPPRRPEIAAASNEQLRAAALVYYGSYDCELGQTMVVTKSARSGGYVDLRAGRSRATLAPVLSSTGAVRLEEVGGGALLVVQIPSKSILFNQKAGKRLIDDCKHAEQKKEAAMAAAKQNSLGMNLPGQVQTDGAPAAQTGQR